MIYFVPTGDIYAKLREQEIAVWTAVYAAVISRSPPEMDYRTSGEIAKHAANYADNAVEEFNKRALGAGK